MCLNGYLSRTDLQVCCYEIVFIIRAIGCKTPNSINWKQRRTYLLQPDSYSLAGQGWVLFFIKTVKKMKYKPSKFAFMKTEGIIGYIFMRPGFSMMHWTQYRDLIWTLHHLKKFYLSGNHNSFNHGNIKHMFKYFIWE